MKHYLAIDLGASSGRAILGTVDRGRIHLEELYRFDNGPVNVNGSLYWNILGLFSEIKHGIRAAVARGLSLSGMAIDTWGVDFALIDRTGQFVGFPYNYRDSHTADVFDWVFDIVPRDEFYAHTGIQFMNINTVFQLASMQRRKMPALEIADKMLLMPNALTYLLCGNVSAEYTHATTTQLYDPDSGDWAWDLIDKLELPRRLFPDIQAPCSVVGELRREVCDELNCSAIPVILAGSHDTACAVASVPASRQDGDWAFLSSGTWSLFGVELDRPIIDDAALAANFTNEGGVGGTIRFLKNIMGLWLVQESRNTWTKEGREYSFAELIRMAMEAPPFQAFVDPNDDRFLAPGNMPERIRQFCRDTGQPIPETPGEIVRCTQESLALCYRRAVEQLESVTGKSIRRLHLVGGGSQDELLNQSTANAIQRPVIVGPTEATALGNIVCQAMAMGDIQDLAEGRAVVKRSIETRDYQPEQSGHWETAYQRFRSLSG